MKTVRHRLLCALLLLLLTFGMNSAWAQITPSQDSYTNTATASTNFGTAATLGVVSSTASIQTAFIKFDLSSIPPGYTSANVAKATLKLYANSVTTAGSLNVDFVNGSWAEKTITASLAPALGNSIASGVPVTSANVHDYVLIDVTMAVGDWLNGSEPNDGLALVANSPMSATFDSKENTAQSHPAELDIVFTSGGTISGVTTASGSGLAGGGTSGTLNLSLQSCAANQVLQWNGSAWACAGVGTGTINGVTAGIGLTGGGNSGNVTLNLDTTQVPQLVGTNTFTGSNTFSNTINGNISGTATGFSGSLSGEVTGPQTATVVSRAVSVNLEGSIVRRDGTGSFSAGSILLGGDLFLPNTTSTNSGVVMMGSNPFLHNFGSSNTFVGQSAGNFSVTGSSNAGFGTQALSGNISGGSNSAFGAFALSSNQSGVSNTAFGTQALAFTNTNFTAAFGAFALENNQTDGNSAFGAFALTNNATGGQNSAFGENALAGNMGGSENSAFGNNALQTNINGAQNAAFGDSALANNGSTGSGGMQNSAFGSRALVANTTGFFNSGFGSNALLSSNNGQYNSAFGADALETTTGNANTALGALALSALTTGSGNIAIGASAGSNLTVESNNIIIGGPGIVGNSGSIQIGNLSQGGSVFIGGIFNAPAGAGVPVYVDSLNHLGTALSSQRFKQDVVSMDKESDVLMKLRPVSFYYKPEYDDPSHTRQYGLIAEEVAKVAPELVVLDEKGNPQTVRYNFVNAMLLNEVQKQRRLVEEQQKENEKLMRLVQAQGKLLTKTRSQLAAQADQLKSIAAGVSQRGEVRKDLALAAANQPRLH